MKEIAQHGPGTLEEMKVILRKFNLYQKLYQRLKLKAQREYEVQCSLDPNEVPSIQQNGAWIKSFIWQLMNTFLKHTAPLNIREIKDNMEKPFTLQSRKIVSVKTLQDSF